MKNLHNIQIEQAVLSTLMTVAESYESVSGDLTTECFYADRHKEIFTAIADLANESKPYDPVLVEQQLTRKDALQLSGGPEYLMQIMADAPSSFFNLEPYVAELKKYKTHREVYEIGQRIVNLSQDLNLQDVYAEAEGLLGQSDSEEKNDRGSSFDEALKSSIQQLIEKAQARENKQFTGVRFNLEHLDRKVGVVHQGHFCVIGGRPGSGKSTLAQMVAIDTALTFGKGVLFVSAEMSKETLANRFVSALGSIPYDNIHNAQLYDGMFEEFSRAHAAYKKLPIWIQDKEKPTINEIRSYARRASRRFKGIGLGCIIVDYLQLVRDPSKKERLQEVSSISRDLKGMAKEFKCPVIALVQLNRESEKNQRPKSSDIKESGQIEQDADQIIMVHPIQSKEDDQPTGVTEMVLTKNRHGKKGVVRVADRLDICRFAGIVDESMGGGV